MSFDYTQTSGMARSSDPVEKLEMARIIDLIGARSQLHEVAVHFDQPSWRKRRGITCWRIILLGHGASLFRVLV